MVESEEFGERRRAPSVRYPGSALPRVAQVVAYLDEVGGTASLGSLASRLNLSEKNADFVRLVASARSYGVADWGNANRSSLRLTEDGEAVAHGTDEERQAALARAFLRPPVFARVARKFGGRGLPGGNGLVEPFKLEGVAESAAPLAARNFTESAIFAGLAEEHSGRWVLATDLPYPPEDAAPRPATTTPAATVRAPAARTGVAAPLATRTPTPLSRVATTSGVTVNVRLDVSGWDVAQVVDLVKRLQESVP